MANVKPDHLPEWQARIIARFFDGESGPIESRVAQLLLKVSGDARAFAQELSVTSTFCRGCATERNDDLATHRGGDGNLWDRIEQRIEAEERAALFLGPRSIVHEQPVREHPVGIRAERAQRGAVQSRSVWNRPFQQIFVGTASGAVTAALILFVASRLTTPPIPTTPTIDPRQLREAQLYPLEGTEQLPLHGLISAGGEPRYRPAGTQLRVDWMRANGPLTLIQNPHGKSAIIWVQRRPIEQTQPRLEAALPRATYVPPTVTFTGLDGSRKADLK
jgi:hypothetical protein